MTFGKDAMGKFAHGVEDTVREIKRHMILSVSRDSIYIALILMLITTVILLIGTLIIWYRHGHAHYEDDIGDSVYEKYFPVSNNNNDTKTENTVRKRTKKTEAS